MPALSDARDGKGAPVLQTMGDPVKRAPVRHLRRPAALTFGKVFHRLPFPRPGKSPVVPRHENHGQRIGKRRPLGRHGVFGRQRIIRHDHQHRGRAVGQHAAGFDHAGFQLRRARTQGGALTSVPPQHRPLPHQGVVNGQPERCGRDSPFLQERQPQLEASVDLAIMRHVHHGQVFVVLHQRPGRIDHQARHPAEATTLHGPQELQGRTLRRQVLGDRRIRRPRPPGVVVRHPGAGRPPTPDRETQHRSLFPASVPT